MKKNKISKLTDKKRKNKLTMSFGLIILASAVVLMINGSNEVIIKDKVKADEPAVASVKLDATLADYPTVGSIPFEALDEDGELDGASRIEKNSPIPFPTELDDGRAYYMYFGALDNTGERIIADESVKTIDDLSVPFPKDSDATTTSITAKKGSRPSLAGPQIAVKPKPPTNSAVHKWATYSYQSGRTMGYKEASGGANYDTGSSFQFMNEEATSYVSKDQYPAILKMFTKGNSVFAYGVIINATDKTRIDGLVRVKMTPQGNEGRVNTTYKYLKISSKSEKVGLAYGLHVDIQNYHTSSAVYSLGNYSGIYFNQKAISDNQPYLLKMHMDGYGNQPNAEFINSNYSGLVIGPGAPKVSPALNAPSTPDVGAGIQYVLAHPVVGFRWNPSLLNGLDAKEFSMEQSVTSKYYSDISVKYVDTNGNSIVSEDTLRGSEGETYTTTPKEFPGYALVETPANANGAFTKVNQEVKYVYSQIGKASFSYVDEQGNELAPPKNVEKKIGEAYQEAPIDIHGYEYTQVIGNATGTICSTPQAVSFVYKENRFSLLQEVTKLDGSSADEVNLGEEVAYKVSLTSTLKEATPAVFYKGFSIVSPIDASLENITGIQLTTLNGTVVGTATYDAAAHTITGKIEETNQVKQSETLILTYQAKVKETVALNTLVKEKAKASGSYTNGMIASEKESNEVASKVIAGELIFESAPASLDFGTPVKISSKEEIYPLKAQDGELSVKDLRGNGKQWSMTAKMSQLLTNTDGSKLPEGLYYQQNGNEQMMGLNESVLIHDETTSSAQSVNLSNSWKDSVTQPFIKVKAGQAKRGVYKGSIQWTLQDVPSGNSTQANGVTP